MRVGFIGCGNMGQAMLAGMLDSGKVKPEDVVVTAKTSATREMLKIEYGVCTEENNIEIAKQADMIFLASLRLLLRSGDLSQDITPSYSSSLAKYIASGEPKCSSSSREFFIPIPRREDSHIQYLSSAI